MSKVYFSSDWHLGHKNIIKHRPECSSIKEHDSKIFEALYALNKSDTLWLLGDTLFDCPDFDAYIDKLRQAKCSIKLLMGNHDSLKLHDPKYSDVFKLYNPLQTYKKYWLSHAPIHLDEMRGRDLNIHGHLHKEIVQRTVHNHVEGATKEPDTNYVNANLDVNGYAFVSLDSIKSLHKLT